MKIIKLTAENLKRLQAVEITPDGNVVKLTGKNGAGKTSVLDAIWYALGGGDSLPSKPIREGEERAQVTLDLGDLVIERRFTAKGSQLVVKNSEGAQYPSPQKMLDALVGRLTFDPLAFMRMKEREQAETLRDLADLDFAEADRERAELYEQRTAVNRQVKSLQSQVEAIHVPDDAPDKEVDVAQLASEMEEAHRHNAEVDTAERNLAHDEDQAIEAAKLVEDLERKLEEARANKSDLDRRVNAEREKVQQMQRVDTDGIVQKMNDAKALNEAVRAKAQRNQLESQLEEYKSESQDLTRRITEIDQNKEQAVRNAKLPIEGLGFDEEGRVTYQGVPVQQASSAEQLRVSVAMAMAINPTLRVLRISDGSLLDSESMQIIEDMAAAGDYQIWMELVDESGQVGVVIEDGLVKAPSQETNND